MPEENKTVRVSVEFSGGVSLEMSHKDVTMSADEATLLGFQLIRAGIHAMTEPLTTHVMRLN